MPPAARGFIARSAETARKMVAGVRHQPIMSVNDLELETVAELHPGGQHVGVHSLHPGDELIQLRRPRGLAYAVDVDAVDEILGWGLLPTAREDVDLHAALHQALSLLADDTRQTSLDQGRVLPRKDQDPVHG